VAEIRRPTTAVDNDGRTGYVATNVGVESVQFEGDILGAFPALGRGRFMLKHLKSRRPRVLGSREKGRGMYMVGEGACQGPDADAGLVSRGRNANTSLY